MKPYVPEIETRKTLVQHLVDEFHDRGFLKYQIDEKHFLILTREAKKIKSLKKYPGSPLPLLSNLESFSNSPGNWNEELLEFGIKTRGKPWDNPNWPSTPGTKIYLTSYKTINARGNQYLKRQYKRLKELRHYNKISLYWKLSWTLMSKSLSFQIANLNSWKSTWYKELTPLEFRKLFESLNQILTLKTIQTQIKNVWIESPKGKWRQLGIPPKAWRLYYHILNNLISYIYEPHLPTSQYDGFIYNRGCKSWWEKLIWDKEFLNYKNIVEVDLSSGFPNLSLKILRQALIDDGLIPENLINLLLHHLKSPLKESTWFPTLETYIENKKNQLWRLGSRSVHMGLGISPILFVITIDWVLRKAKIQNKNFQYRCYADDWSFYFNFRGIYQLLKENQKSLFWAIKELIKGNNLILSLFNNLTLFQQTGLRLCPQKSRLIKLYGVWIHPYISLGLKLYTEQTRMRQLWTLLLGQEIPLNLQGYTRGRGANQSKRTSGTLASRTKLNYSNNKNKRKLNYKTLVTTYKNYFGLLMSRLYTGKSQPLQRLKPSSNPKETLYSHFKKKETKRTLKKFEINLNRYNIGSKLNELILKINMKEPLPLEWKEIYPNNRELQFKWNDVNRSISNILIPNILKEDEILTNDYFYKFSELKIDPFELKQLTKEYETLMCPKTKEKLY